MPLISESPVFDETVLVPADGDARTIGSLLPALETVTDRTRYLKAELDSGAKFIRRVTSLSALKALTGVVDGEVRFVDDLGLYRYAAASALATNEPRVAVPTSIAGRWIHSGNGIDVANGFASLASDAKVKTAQLRGYLDANYDFVDGAAPTSETTKTITSTSGLSPDTLLTTPLVGSVSLGVGDQGIVRATFCAKLGTAAGVVFLLALTTSLGDTVLDVFDIALPPSSGVGVPVVLEGALGKQLSASTVSSVKLQAYAATPGTVLVYKPASFRPKLYHFKG